MKTLILILALASTGALQAVETPKPVAVEAPKTETLKLAPASQASEVILVEDYKALVKERDTLKAEVERLAKLVDAIAVQRNNLAAQLMNIELRQQQEEKKP